jgi:hypothetical protein
MTPFFSLLLGVLITLVLVAMKSRFVGFRTQRPPISQTGARALICAPISPAPSFAKA